MHDIIRDERFRRLSELLRELQRDYGMGSESIARQAAALAIPVSIFEADRTPLICCS